ncbi:hypothetical protein LITTLEE_106 [Mycobacterium phage LittleE]|uniref:Uncharacterized protein n=4 Tax=Omegavirus TaxID=1623292 RepID=Q854F6_BPMOM|nr:gp112 [Mycobacterium phage Omega]YP_009011996.1 hypothetical protein CM09_gp097 [Mycobacterium phage Courthouse]YP_009205232.1 hypothetical protein AVT17_gp102 [Mycobacterium phage Ariel]YP_009213319.1 hypothetical protein AVV70_gp102 [Mycobacterium phage MiaZeal]YP_009637017.1 hypothetical protein FGG27_gp106 [Mycobacterium phage LittleE]ASD50729.1 hypothetical protein PORCELAIN_100 [Mycobacterium phage Porcelain]ASD53492.1 hypothetical protein PBI_LUCKY2013_99 [Mycobacterium phage Lucky2
MTTDQAAKILYLAYHKDRYAPHWESAPDQSRWRQTAAALLREMK